MRLFSCMITLVLAAVVANGYNIGSRHLLDSDIDQLDNCHKALGFESYAKCRAYQFWGKPCSDDTQCFTPVSGCIPINETESESKCTKIFALTEMVLIVNG